VLKGVYLTLLIGPGVPIPAPKIVVDSVESVQVTSSIERSGFQLTFKIAKTSPLITTMLPAGFFDPGITRVIVIVTVKGMPNVLADGIITQQEMSPSNEPGQTTLTVTGEDLSILMGVIEFPFMQYPAMPEIARIPAILAKYAVFGIIPVVIPPMFQDIPIPIERNPPQKGSRENNYQHATDLDYIKQMAQQCGYVFYVEPGPAPGANIAYFGPDIRIPNPQPALSINMDGHTNVESLSFSLDGTKKKIVVLNTLDPVTKKITIPVPVPNISILRPPLGARPTIPMKLEFSTEEANWITPIAIMRALARTASSSDAISGSGSLNVTRYGHILKSRQLVGVRGAGLAYDGLYYVQSVTHNLKRGEYKQNFSLSRDGLISNTPKVLP
jgi:hypothetical protein